MLLSEKTFEKNVCGLRRQIQKTSKIRITVLGMSEIKVFQYLHTFASITFVHKTLSKKYSEKPEENVQF